MAVSDPPFARVIVDVRPAHLDRPFDYRIPEGATVAVGSAVRVRFAGRRRTGWVVDLADAPEADPARVQPLQAVLGDHAWFDAADLRLYRWVAQRYAGTLADVLRHALPGRVAGVERETSGWSSPPVSPPAQPPCATTAWRPYNASMLLRATAQRDAGAPACWLTTLVGDDREGLVADLVSRTLTSGRSVLVLAPDPASPLPDAALAVAGGAGVDLRAATQRGRYRSFLRGRAGAARVVVGERGAVFAPLRDLGLVVVDDEANPAYKERRSPRHHAREVALARARMAGAVCVLLGDLPSAALWRLLDEGHVATVAADRGTQRSRTPRVEVVDLGDPRPQTRRARLTDAAARSLRRAVEHDGVGVVLASRGGQGAALACRNCRRRLACPQCLGSLAAARESTAWICATCGWSGAQFSCPDCGDERWSPLAAGAARLAGELARIHPQADVARMEGFDAPGPNRRPALGVLTRGSVVTQPAWLAGERADVVVVPDADAMLRRPAFDAAEDALRLWMAVARWTDLLVLQTREPRHPAVQALVRSDPNGYWEREAEVRAELGYPPARSLLSVTAPVDVAQEVAAALREQLPADDDILGPDLSGATLVKARALAATLAALRPLREDWGLRDRKVRVDVDPLL